MNLEIQQKWLKFRYMSFLEIINKKKVILISIFLFIYIIINLFEGERGLISYFEKKSTFKNLSEEKALLTKKLKLIEKENSLLTDVIDLDYLETLYREKFMLGKKSEKIYINK